MKIEHYENRISYKNIIKVDYYKNNDIKTEYHTIRIIKSMFLKAYIQNYGMI